MIIQGLLEKEVEEYLGRGSYRWEGIPMNKQEKEEIEKLRVALGIKEKKKNLTFLKGCFITFIVENLKVFKINPKDP